MYYFEFENISQCHCVITIKVEWVDIKTWRKTGYILQLLDVAIHIHWTSKVFSNIANVSLMSISQVQLTQIKLTDQGDLGLCIDKIITSVINDLSTLLILNKSNLIFNPK